MNGLNKFMDGLYKVIAPLVEAVFALFITIAGNMGIQSYKLWKLFGSSWSNRGGTGFITFIQLIYWLVALAYIASKVLKAVHTLTSDPQALNALKSSSPAPQNNAYAQSQQNFAQPMQQTVSTPAPVPVPAPAANADAEKFCTQCGAKVPASSGFCTSCGAKMI